tara:strand:+ start:12255 stop:12773 length:519 start_codon:yes stop_codon:yes gene_type:complete
VRPAPLIQQQGQLALNSLIAIATQGTTKKMDRIVWHVKPASTNPLQVTGLAQVATLESIRDKTRKLQATHVFLVWLERIANTASLLVVTVPPNRENTAPLDIMIRGARIVLKTTHVQGVTALQKLALVEPRLFKDSPRVRTVFPASFKAMTCVFHAPVAKPLSIARSNNQNA